MGSPTSERAFDVSVSSGTPYLRATVTTAGGEVLAIPAAWQGMFVRFCAMGSDVYIRFGTSNAVAVDYTTVSSVTSNVMTAGGSEPHLVVPAGAVIDEHVLKSMTFFTHKSPNTSGYLYVCLATGQGS